MGPPARSAGGFRTPLSYIHAEASGNLPEYLIPPYGGTVHHIRGTRFCRVAR